MDHPPKRELPDELLEVRDALVGRLEILDWYEEHEVALNVCTGYERLIGAPSTMEQGYMMIGRGPNGEDIEGEDQH